MEFKESKPARKSKTIASGIVTMAAGAILATGAAKPQYPKTFDDFDKPQNNTKQSLIGMGLIGSGAIAIKGRYDANKSIKKNGDKK
jgi:hypothetical protein